MEQNGEQLGRVLFVLGDGGFPGLDACEKPREEGCCADDLVC